ncbi:MAG TPA: class I SAM-dependent methyltransferase [Opitutaceae bacterium]|nr:class I SAM-dependent methyltransferase [Opitutaceae bacterium]
MSPNHADRVSAEKAFHNARFSSGPSTQPGTKYYLALEEWYRDYFSRIMALGASNILELGAGTQSLALQVDHANFEFASIDISDEAVAFAERHKRLPQARFSVDDAHHTQFPAGSFDLVIGRGILHHLDIPAACAEIKRVLKPGGRIVFGEPLDGNALINLYRKLTPNIRSRDERPLSYGSLKLLGSHFGELDIRYYGFLTLGLAVFGLRSPRRLHRFDGFLLNTLGLGRFLAWACLISTSASPGA